MPQIRSVCHDCSKPIGNEPTLLAGDKLVHLKHFRCHFCLQLIEATDSFHLLSSGKVVCLPCFATKLAPKCAKCGDGIVENGVRAANQDWHASCLRCSKCQNLLIGSFLLNFRGQPIDYDCFWGEKLQQIVSNNSKS
uniref:LIM zinc-binding domain-containing protein n=1 Tax=Panagrolaimus sp. JU765 TaxID=591449 RepID=A0AC34QJH6_9BILA